MPCAVAALIKLQKKTMKENLHLSFAVQSEPKYLEDNVVVNPQECFNNKRKNEHAKGKNNYSSAGEFHCSHFAAMLKQRPKIN